MKCFCQMYMPAFYRSYGEEALMRVTGLLPVIEEMFNGIYLIGLWEDGGYDNGFDIVSYSVNHEFGTDKQLEDFVKRAHYLNLEVCVDVVPNHVSDKHPLAQNCLNGVPGYEDCLYVVSEAEAKRLTEAGVPSFFGKLAYSDFGDKYVRSTFCDYHQLNLNWRSQKVQEYFRGVFQDFKRIGIDFVRVDCGMMLLEDVSKADKDNPMACMNPAASIEAIRRVADGMPMFFEWFDLESADLFNDIPECYALDCSYVMTGRQNLDWSRCEKLIPLVGGHDQMTLADRTEGDRNSLIEFIKCVEKKAYAFADMQTLIRWKTDPEVLPDDDEYDADINNPNQRYRARRPIEPVVEEFIGAIRSYLQARVWRDHLFEKFR